MIYVPQHTERILINHSSGMDSTLLIYLLLTELKNQSLLDKVKIFINTGFDPIADPYAPERSKNICDIVFKKFGATYTHNSFEYRDGKDTKIPDFQNFIKKFKIDYDIDVYYRGTSLGPPKDIQEKYNYHKPERDYGGLAHIENQHLDFPHLKARWTIIPYWNKDKKWIVNEWKKSDFLMNEVYHLTFSCVLGKEATHNWTKHCYDNYPNNIRKWCWWCVEKKWAFEELDV